MSQEGAYSELKPVRWYALEGRLPDAPKQVQLILSDLCNQDCSFCAYRMSGYTSNELFMGDSEASKYGHSNPKRWIPTDRALSLLNEFKEAGVLAVQFTGGGEPTVHPDHEEIFDKALRLGLRCALVSNGIKWSDTLISNTLPRFDWVRVSIDAGNRESYARMRHTPESNWNRVWMNVRALATEIKQADSPCALGLGYVVTPESWGEILEFSRLASYSGAHNIRFSALFSPEDEHPFDGIHEQIVEVIQSARRMFPSLRIYDNFGSRIEDLKQHNPDYKRCGYMHYTSYVGADLNNYVCCVYSYNKRGLMTNLKEQSFSNWWRSDERKEFMGNFDARGCERCQFNQKNRALNYVIDGGEHMEWT